MPIFFIFLGCLKLSESAVKWAFSDSAFGWLSDAGAFDRSVLETHRESDPFHSLEVATVVINPILLSVIIVQT